MAVVLALLSALSYGVSDFLAGLVARAWDARAVGVCAQAVGLTVAVVAVLLFGGDGPHAGALEWGALSGVGSAVGTLALYRGLAEGSIGIVAPVCGVLTSVVPAIVGIALGDSLTGLELLGVVLTVPAVGLVSRQSSGADGNGNRGPSRGSLLSGFVAGVGFGLLFVALDRAGTRSGAWPLIPGQAVSLVLLVPVAWPVLTTGRPDRPTLARGLLVGVLSGAANLFFLLATRHGELAVVGVLGSLYPAATVVLAAVVLGDRWTRIQRVGMAVAALAVVFVALG